MNIKKQKRSYSKHSYQRQLVSWTAKQKLHKKYNKRQSILQISNPSLNFQSKLLVQAYSLSKRSITKFPNISHIRSSRETLKKIEKQDKVQKIQRKLQINYLNCQCSYSFDLNQKKQIYTFQSHQTREIASLTKIMTVYLCIEMIGDLKIKTNEHKFRTTKLSVNLPGTTADLKQGQWYTIQDLLYGAMLPSGNDAAYMLSEIFGKIIYFSINRKNPYKFQPGKNSLEKQEQSGLTKLFTKLFINQMNSLTKKLFMNHTKWANPHGLSNVENRSSARDLKKLCEKCIQNEAFLKICKSKDYLCTYSDDTCKRHYKFWKNSNKLIDQNWNGIKTGITTSAGGCLACYWTNGIQRYILIVLGCQNQQGRFVQMKKLLSLIKQKKP